jgi:hypothetical protein
VLLLGYNEIGQAELEFADPFTVQTDSSTHTHSIWVAPEFVRPCSG